MTQCIRLYLQLRDFSTSGTAVEMVSHVGIGRSLGEPIYRTRVLVASRLQLACTVRSTGSMENGLSCLGLNKRHERKKSSNNNDMFPKVKCSSMVLLSYCTFSSGFLLHRVFHSIFC